VSPLRYPIAQQQPAFEPKKLTDLELWLRDTLEMPMPEAQEHLSIWQDPLRSGTYLCQVVQKYLKIDFEFIKQPKNLN
jgi:hypothetical protein